MEKDKNKKKTLTISSNFGKKLDSSTYSHSGKKSFSISKKPIVKSSFKPQRPFKNVPSNQARPKPNKKNFARKKYGYQFKQI